MLKFDNVQADKYISLLLSMKSQARHYDEFALNQSCLKRFYPETKIDYRISKSTVELPTIVHEKTDLIAITYHQYAQTHLRLQFHISVCVLAACESSLPEYRTCENLEDLITKCPELKSMISIVFHASSKK